MTKHTRIALALADVLALILLCIAATIHAADWGLAERLLVVALVVALGVGLHRLIPSGSAS